MHGIATVENRAGAAHQLQAVHNRQLHLGVGINLRTERKCVDRHTVHQRRAPAQRTGVVAANLNQQAAIRRLQQHHAGQIHDRIGQGAGSAALPVSARNDADCRGTVQLGFGKRRGGCNLQLRKMLGSEFKKIFGIGRPSADSEASAQDNATDTPETLEHHELFGQMLKRTQSRYCER